jgi:DNA-binding CsgD family transcriptional regulator
MGTMNERSIASRGAAALSDLGGNIRCDRQAEEILQAFWGEIRDGAQLPPELRGLMEGAQLGPPGVRRSLVMEQPGERLRVEATAVGRGRTHLRLWREPLKQVGAAPDPTPAAKTNDPLTQREREVALLVAEGLRSIEVAERLGIASQTVKSHLKAIFDKMGVRNRVELARLLQQQ